MNIVFISFYSGINVRGVERWVKDLSIRLSKDHHVIVFQNGPTVEKTPYTVISVGMHYKERSSSRLSKRFFLDYQSLKVFMFNLKILKQLFTCKCDIYVPIDGGWEPAVVRIVSWLRQKKMVIVGHAGIGCDDANNLWSFPDTFVALSSYAKDWARKINPFVRVEYIPDAVDISKFKAKGEKLNLSLNPPIILSVAALEKGKRQELIIKAVSVLKNFSLLLVGSGPLKDHLKNTGEELLGDRFQMKTFDFGKMPQVYRSCDLFVSASTHHYSFEMVLLEAMAAGLPVVANDDPIRREIVGDAGLFADPTKTDEFSGAIKEALTQKWGDKPLRQAEKFSWERIYKKYEEMFLTLLK